MNQPTSNSVIVIRDLQTIEDLRKVPEIEQEVWESHDRDSIPMTLLIAAKEAGAIVLGAFDGEKMVGMAFGFPGWEHGRVSIHSHMAAVLAPYRNLNLGYKLKLAQRDRALSMGIDEITWTFDPLQARNAHFNFFKLGVISDRYKIDFYGRESSSSLHQNGTDRLWVSWRVKSDRVYQRLKSEPQLSGFEANLRYAVRSDEGGRPQVSAISLADDLNVGVQIPADIAGIEARDMSLAFDWRLATRSAFTELLGAGFHVTEFLRGVPEEHMGSYVLQKNKSLQ